MSELTDYQKFMARCEIADAVAYFGWVTPNTEEQKPYYLKLLEDNLPLVGWPTVHINYKPNKAGKITLVFLWSDCTTFMRVYKSDAEIAHKWFEEYSMRIRSIR